MCAWVGGGIASGVIALDDVGSREKEIEGTRLEESLGGGDGVN